MRLKLVVILIVIVLLVLAACWPLLQLILGARKMPYLPVTLGIRLVEMCPDGRVLAVRQFDTDLDNEVDMTALYASDRPAVPAAVYDQRDGKLYVDEDRDGIIDRITDENDPEIGRGADLCAFFSAVVGERG